MISKELLSSVLGLTVVKGLELEGIVLWYNGIVNINNQPPYAKELNINIYELAHKCKEWALKHHYKVISKPDNVPGLWEAYVNLSLTSKHGEVADTEPEAIFKACQWILDKDSK